MRFNATLNVDFAQWKMVKLERENNLKEFKGMDEDMPKFGAGSEYNRELREEVRRKKYGIVAKRYKPEAQPWILKVGGKSGKKFRGIREGGVGENAAFYVFAHAPDGCIEAYPLNEWYNFQPIQRYKALSAEEAEHEFGRRKKVMNYFSLMLRKRMKGDDEEPEDPEETKLKKAAAKKGKELKISDMDEWMESDDDSDDDSDADEKPKKDDDGGGSGDDAKKKKKGKGMEKKKKKRDLDDEAFEESDDGDEEGRELDYISDSSDSEPDPESKANKEMKSVAEEDALRKLLTSDEDSDEEKKSGESDKEEDDAKNKKEAKEAKDKETRDKKRKKLKKKDKDEKKDSSSEISSNSSDSDGEAAVVRPPSKKQKHGASSSNSRSASPSVSTGPTTVDKRKVVTSMPTDLGMNSENSNSPTATPAKRVKMDQPTLPSSISNVVNCSNSKE